ncbi:MAG: extracellular solute-binding protein [SAR324 cluster bacterium]|nr:extracellular solute-binding protein [SAR324 cluster bacterium]
MKFLKKLSILVSTVFLTGSFFAVSPVMADTVEVNLWSRADRSGPLRPGNIVAAADLLNKQYKAAGVDKTITVKIHENNAKGFDADALDLFKAFAAGKGPDLYVAAHEWIGALAESGYAMNLEEHINAYPEYYSDIIPTLWGSALYKGERHAVPQDSEIRMFFYRKDMLRKIGKSEDFVNSLPDKVNAGEFTMMDLSKLAKEVVDAGVAEYGIIHRPNVGPDFLMAMASFGFEPMDQASGKLKASKKALMGFLSWIDWNASNGVTPRNNTSFSWDTVNHLLPEGKAFIKHHGVWDVGRQIKFGVSEDSEAAYTKNVGWLNSPPAEKGGTPKNLSHPIVYAVNPKSSKKELAALLIAIASQPYFNTKHAIGSNHTAINYGQESMPDYQKAWPLRMGTPMLKYTTIMPNHPDIGQFNQIIYKGIQGVETDRLKVDEAVSFVLEELEGELGDKVMIVD